MSSAAAPASDTIIDDGISLLRHVVANAGSGDEQDRAGYLSNLSLALRVPS